MQVSASVPVEGLLFPASLLLRRSVFRMVEASAKRERLAMNLKGPWVGYRWQAVSFPPCFARAHIFIERETSGYEADPLQCAKFTGGIFLL